MPDREDQGIEKVGLTRELHIPIIGGALFIGGEKVADLPAQDLVCETPIASGNRSERGYLGL